MSFKSDNNSESNSKQHFPSWTGFNGRTLYDFLNLAGVVAVPLLIAGIGCLQWWMAEQREVQEERLAVDRQYQEVMSSYLQQMTKLQIEYKSFASFSQTAQTDPVQRERVQNDIGRMARAITLNAARQLDGERKGQLLKFLYESDLIGGQCELDSATGQPTNCKINGSLQLDGAKLRETINDPDVPLFMPGSDLSEAHLHDAELSKINLAQSNMSAITLRDADLSKATLSDAKMVQAVLEGANLTCAILTRTELSGANLKNANFARADLQGAKLKDLKVEWAGASFKGALYDDETELPDGLDKEAQGMLQATDANKTERKKQCSRDEEWFVGFQEWVSKIAKS